MTPRTESTLPRARAILRRYSLLSLGAGLVPVPVVDLAALGGLQLAMIRELARLYGIRFYKHRSRYLISALLGGSGAVLLARGLGLYTVLGPGAWVLLKLGGVAALGGASTYALGKTFIQHFETGGSFLDFDPERMRDYYQAQLRQAPAGSVQPASFAGIRP